MKNHPTTLYKFLGVKGAKKTLKKRSLLYRHPNEFNDPFEFMPGGYTGDTQEEKSRIARAQLLNNNNCKTRLSAKTKIEYTEQQWEALVDDLPGNKNFLNSVFLELKIETGIVSLKKYQPILY